MDTAIYRKIPYEYEAIEISKLLAAKVNGTMDLAPKWIRDAIFEGRLSFPDTAPCAQINVLPGVPRLGAARDYLMRGPLGQLSICPPETLAEQFEQVDHPLERIQQLRPLDRCPVCTSTGGMHADKCPNGE